MIIKMFIRESLSYMHLPMSDSAVNLLAMIALHESGGLRYVRQINGPALGLWQMEDIAYRHVRNYVQNRSDRFDSEIVNKLSIRKHEWLNVDQVFACHCARIYLLTHPEPLPEATDIMALADYAKRYWNTSAGKATVDDYFDAYFM